MIDAILRHNEGAHRLERGETCHGRGCRHEVEFFQGCEYWVDDCGNPICYHCARDLYGECADCHYPTQFCRRRGDKYICAECYERMANEDAAEELRRLEMDEEADHEYRVRIGD